MAKSAFEKAIEKQQKEEQKRMQKQQLINTAASVVNGQTCINGMRIMDEDSELCLKTLISLFDGNSSYRIQFQDNKFPEHLQNSLKLHLEKLKQYGMISDYTIFIIGSGEAVLTATGLNYFHNKETAICNRETGIKKSVSHKEYDVFISHANKDKLDYVDELVDGIKQLGIRIFYDKDEISWGDNWKGKILNGTKQSEFAIIVISENFFGREWTEKELTEFLNRQNESGQKIILPLLYNITFDDVTRKYPQLEDIQGLIAENYIVEEIVILLAKELIKRYKEV